MIVDRLIRQTEIILNVNDKKGVTGDKLVFSSYFGNVIKDLGRGEYLIKPLNAEEQR